MEQARQTCSKVDYIKGKEKDLDPERRVSACIAPDHWIRPGISSDEMKPEVHYIIPAAVMNQVGGAGRKSDSVSDAARLYASQQSNEAKSLLEIDKSTESILSDKKLDIWEKARRLTENLQKLLAVTTPKPEVGPHPAQPVESAVQPKPEEWMDVDPVAPIQLGIPVKPKAGRPRKSMSVAAPRPLKRLSTSFTQKSKKKRPNGAKPPLPPVVPSKPLVTRGKRPAHVSPMSGEEDALRTPLNQRTRAARSNQSPVQSVALIKAKRKAKIAKPNDPAPDASSSSRNTGSESIQNGDGYRWIVI